MILIKAEKVVLYDGKNKTFGNTFSLLLFKFSVPLLSVNTGNKPTLHSSDENQIIHIYIYKEVAELCWWPSGKESTLPGGCGFNHWSGI